MKEEPRDLPPVACTALLACAVCGKRMVKLFGDDGNQRIFRNDGSPWEYDVKTGKCLCPEHASPIPNANPTENRTGHLVDGTVPPVVGTPNL